MQTRYFQSNEIFAYSITQNVNRKFPGKSTHLCSEIAYTPRRPMDWYVNITLKQILLLREFNT